MDNIEEVKTKQTIPEREQEILKFWRDHNIFQKSLDSRKDGETYVFYDGPPFATGTPHYGHILASAIKDAVPRYQTMRGKYVPRRWGWDCHGLPIENIVEKDLGLSGKKEIEAYGIDKFNAYARSKVLTYVHEWKKTIERMGRWVDFDGSYKTMDNTYIESVWWAVKELYDKGLVYEGVRVLPYCPRCETPIANSEIAMDNSYKDITDISVIVKFELVDEPGTYLLAWTTTPWTLPGNTAAAVNEQIIYAKVAYEGVSYIAAKSLLPKLFAGDYQLLAEFPGSALVGKRYQPLFSYFQNKDFMGKENAWQVYAAPYVSEETGSGIVHLAPAFGEEDMALAEKYHIPFVHHVGPDGKFTSEVTDFAGQPVKPKDDHQRTDIELIKYLAHAGKLFAKEKIVHSYPHCFRCETPLYYYALPAWFIKIDGLKKRLIELNEDINWVPAHLKDGRFKKSMEAAPDWNISRNRYWASPLPIWKCETCRKVHIIGSTEDVLPQIKDRNTFLFLRHGRGVHNDKRIVDTILPGQPLDDEGRTRITELTKELKEKGITKIVASPFARTQETAEIVAKALGLPVETDERFREMGTGEFNGRTVTDWKKAYPSDQRWHSAPTGGETWTEVQERMVEALTELNSRYTNETILVVSHGDPLFVLFVKLAGITDPVGEEYPDVPYPLVGEVRENFSVALFDLHRPYVDELTFACDCGGTMRRIPEVIDCWFESGSMPFAANHYPFENKEWFKQNFPADFVAEYIAQTRTWFYYMHVLATSLFDSVPFRYVVTTGTILAEDGQKMSKSKGNFPDPSLIFDRYGVDALRFHLLSSSLLKAEDMNFSEQEVADVYKRNLLRLQNVLEFYKLYRASASSESPKSGHVLDRWIIARLALLRNQITDAMDQYSLDEAVTPIDGFIDDLSTWYVRRSRDRFRVAGEGQTEAVNTLRFVLGELAKLMAPFTPFMAESIYQSVHSDRDVESVHLALWPEKGSVDQELLTSMEHVRQIVTLGLEARAAAGIKIRQPLASMTVRGKRLDASLEEILRDELNLKQIQYEKGDELTVELDTTLTPELKKEGLARDLMRQIQSFRKSAAVKVGEDITVIWQTDRSDYVSILGDPAFQAQLLATSLEQGSVDETQPHIVSEDNALRLGLKG